MSKRLPLFVTAALVGVMFVFALALVYMVRYYRLSRVEQMEQRLEAIARTLASGLDEQSMVALAEVYSPVTAALGAAYDQVAPASENGFSGGFDTPIPTEEDYRLLGLLNDLCAEVIRQNDLRSLRIITSEGVTLAAPDDPSSIGERTAFYEIDRAEINEALATGEAAPLPFYWAEGNAHKRLYLPLYPQDSRGDDAEGEAQANAEPEAETAVQADTDAQQEVAGSDEPGDEIRILIRLEAGAEFLEELNQLRSIRRRVMLIMLGLVGVLGALFYIVLRRLQRSSEQLAHADRFRSLGRLAAGLAHELRNPLGIIRFNVEELQWQHQQAEQESAPNNLERVAQGLPEEPAEIELRDGLTTEMMEEIDRMNRLITNILSFSQEGELNAQGTCDWREVAERARRWVEKSAPMGWDICASWDGAADAPEELQINGDALLQILLNLSRNAVDALEGQEEPKPRIEIAAKYEEGKLVFSVSDNGPGIPRKIQKRIFEPFYTNKEGGTGIGLAMSRRLAESVGGSLTYEPSAERGSLFVLGINGTET